MSAPRPFRFVSRLALGVAGLLLTSVVAACFEHADAPPPDEGLASQLTLTKLDASSSSHVEVTNLDQPARGGGGAGTGAGAAGAGGLGAAGGSDDGGIPAQIGARHILVQYIGAQSAGPQVVRTRAQALSTAQEVLRRVKAGDDFARMAVEFSDEPNAGSRGGSLGRFGHGQMVPEFEAAAFRLKVGQISGIVETPFGFHIIQRTE
jgi:hypothetical protein